MTDNSNREDVFKRAAFTRLKTELRHAAKKQEGRQQSAVFAARDAVATLERELEIAKADLARAELRFEAARQLSTIVPDLSMKG